MGKVQIPKHMWFDLCTYTKSREGLGFLTMLLRLGGWVEGEGRVVGLGSCQQLNIENRV